MPRDFPHHALWRAVRLGALVVFLPVAVFSAAAVSLLWRLSSGPLDITPLAARFMPLAVQASGQPGRPAGRLTARRISLSWHPGLRHLHPELGIMAQDLRVLRQDGTATLAIAHASIDLRMGPLSHGRIVPTRISADTGSVILDRHPDGSIDLDWPNARHGRSRPDQFSPIHLVSVDLRAIRVVLRHAIGTGQDQHVVRGSDLTAQLETASFRRAPVHALFGWNGTLAGWVGPDPDHSIRLRSTASTGLDAVDCRLDIAPFEPQLFGGLLPLASNWHVPVSASFSFHFPLNSDATGNNRSVLPTPGKAHLALTLGKGSIDQRDNPPLSIESGEIRGEVHLAGGRLSVPEFHAGIGLVDDLGHVTRFGAQGAVEADSLLSPQKITARLSASSTALDVPHLSAIWPRILMKGARKWVTRNLTAGAGSGVAIESTLGSATGWGGLRPVRTAASLSVDHATVHWLRPVPPAQDVAARFSFETPDTLRIDFLGGVQPSSERQGAPVIHMDGGSMLISDLFARDQLGKVALDLSCNLSACLGLLAHPRLHLLSRHPLPFTHPDGAVTVREVITLPLSSHIENDQIHLTATARFSHVSLGNVVLGRDLAEASGVLDATEKRLTLKGYGLLDGVPTEASMEENFLSREGGLRESVHAVSELDEAALRRASITNNGLFHGRAELVSDYHARFDGRADVDLALDLQDADLSIPVWRKSAGTEASASAHIGLKDGHIVALDRVLAEGPDLHVAGSGRVSEGRVSAIVLDGFTVGRSNGDAVIELPGEEGAAVNVHVHAQDLDMSSLLHAGKPAGDGNVLGKGKKATLPSAPEADASTGKKTGGLNWTVDLATERLFYGPHKFFGQVTAHLEHRNDRLERARFTAKRPVGLLVDLFPRQDGRHFDLRVDNLGLLLTETGMTERLDGGTARVTGHVGDSATGTLPPFQGVISVSPFTFRQPPAALTAATHLSVFNWSQASHDRFEVQHLHLPVRLHDDVMTIHEGHLGNPALGATLEGNIGLDSGVLDLRGTVVPVFGINAAPGRLPNVGKLFSPEKGGGVLAATFTVKGTANNPDLSVNPFAMLLPGVMRELAK
ncbi:AsmA-like C-terminal region-containing protein [Asaia krungthepensis]|uniref:AsmA-like C-terminal domain-containing protein n=1 Tax=Asaia krungthepensis NRIC 0535 TaxID=1307925 RepID=A0ABQ0Q660_9PROT|nr:AsmA-like C-terminal region-containing protein [Asaia krungthepensis]GBQ93195.1 hypothetical protein AA0535_2767 [Asaia krungthepensis NRIC 0535]